MPNIQDIIHKATNFRAWRLFKQVEPYTMVGHPRLYVLYELMRRIETQGLEGDIVECGVWKGGAAGVIGTIIKRYGYKRKLWLFDSFAGMPQPSTADGSKAQEQYDRDKGLSSELDVNAILHEKLKINQDAVKIIPGWFQETLPTVKESLSSIALLRLDCDWYESTKICLDTLYGRVVPGGYILVDDYGSWPGCKQAIDEFLSQQKSCIDLKPAGSGAVYFQKPISDAGAKYWSTETQKYKKPHLRLKRLAGEIIQRTPKNGTVLDIGCGPGTLGDLIRNSSLRYSGVDIFEQQIPFGKYKVFDLNNSPFSNFPVSNRFDTIVVSGVLEYLPQERIRLLLNHIVQNLILPSSTIIITYTNFSHYSQHSTEYHSQWITTVKLPIIQGWFEQAGLNIQNKYPTYYFLFRRRLTMTVTSWMPILSSLLGRQIIFVMKCAGARKK